jgi:hypothetical protein
MLTPRIPIQIISVEQPWAMCQELQLGRIDVTVNMAKEQTHNTLGKLGRPHSKRRHTIE